jgi:hypothetical protein
LADNIIAGSGSGMESQIKVFSSIVPSESGKAPDVFSARAVPLLPVGSDAGHRNGRIGPDGRAPSRRPAGDAH